MPRFLPADYSRRSIVAIFIVALCCNLVAGISAALDIRTDGDSIVFEGVTVGGELGIMWAATIYGTLPSTSSGSRILGDDDQDGVITFDAPARGMTPGAVWALVDIESGESRVFVLNDPGLPPTDISAEVSDYELPESVDILSGPGTRVSLILVRPGVGAWVSEGFDGTTTDHDPTANIVGIPLSEFIPEGRATGDPTRTQAGDIAVSLDSRTKIVTIATSV